MKGKLYGVRMSKSGGGGMLYSYLIRLSPIKYGEVKQSVRMTEEEADKFVKDNTPNLANNESLSTALLVCSYVVGAGRPKLDDADKAKQRAIRLTDDHWDKFLLIGGVKWLRRMLTGEAK